MLCSLIACVALLPSLVPATGTWTALTNLAPGAINLLLLLPDGTVMAEHSGGPGWYRLTPDGHGSYVNGTWTSLASMHNTRTWFSSAVLRDGRVFVAGAEYGTGGTNAEVYDPSSDAWTLRPLPLSLLDPSQPSPGYPGRNQALSESIATTLPNGNILLAPKQPATYGGTVIFNILANTWSAGPTLYRGGFQDEANWVKLPDDSIITVDPFGTNSERYIPSLNAWINDANVPVAVYGSPGGELGAAVLLPDGRAFFLGGSGHTALYVPTGTTAPGTWQAGPDIPNGLAAPDGAAAMMVNGKLLCTFGPPVYTNGSGNLVFPPPTSYYEFDPVANAFTAINGPTGPTNDLPVFNGWMLDLPDGTVLYAYGSDQLYVYQPDGSPLASGKPAITSVNWNTNGSLHLTGTLFNGISAGALFGDDNQMDSNYPLVRLTDSFGNVYYARTHHWSSSGVMTGSTPLTTEANLPDNLPSGVYSLVVIANGISSDAVLLQVPEPFSRRWTPTSAPTNYFWSGLAASADGTKLVATAYYDTNFDPGPIYVSTNSGWSWTISGAPLDFWYAVASSTNGTHLVAATGSGSIYTSTNSGATWTITPAPYGVWNSLASSYDGTRLAAVAAAVENVIYTSTNSGATWTSNNVPHNQSWYRVASSADGTRLVVVSNSDTNGNPGAIFTSTNGGAAWVSNTVAANFWTGVASSGDGQKLFACTGSGKVYTSANAGAQWTASSGLIGYFTGIAASADGSKLVLVANSGRIYTSTDSGAHWIANNVPALEWEYDTASLDGNIAVAAIPFGRIYTLQTPPVVTSVLSNNDGLLSWPWPSAGFALQQNTNLTGTKWTAVTNLPVLTSNWRDLVTVPNPQGFFRLILKSP